MQQAFIKLYLSICFLHLVCISLRTFESKGSTTITKPRSVEIAKKDVSIIDIDKTYDLKDVRINMDENVFNSNMHCSNIFDTNYDGNIKDDDNHIMICMIIFKMKTIVK